MKLAIITALHGRYRLTRLFLDYWRTLDVPGVDLLLSCAISTDEYKMRELVTQEYPEWSPVYAPNMPLTGKFAANMQNVEAWKPDAMMIIGSDDFINAAYIAEGVRRMQNADFIGGNTVHYLKAGTQQMISQQGHMIGAGRILSRPLLEFMEWHPWDNDNIRLDASMIQRLSWEGITPEVMTNYHQFGGAMLDVKTVNQYGNVQNQRTFDSLRRSPHQNVNAHDYLHKHFHSIAETLLTW